MAEEAAVASRTLDRAVRTNASLCSGSVSALCLALLISMQIGIFVIYEPPVDGSAQEWLRLFQADAVGGLLSFELLMVIYQLMSIPAYASLYLVLAPLNRHIMLLFAATSGIAIVSFLSSRPCAEMLYISQRLSESSIDGKGSISSEPLVAAAEVLVAQFHGSGFYVAYVLGSVSGTLLSIAMLQSGGLFSKTLACTRLASALLDWGLVLPWPIRAWQRAFPPCRH